MLLNNLCRRGTPSFGKLRSTRAVIRAQPKRTVITWLEQDNWEDPKGPLGINRPSPKLAPLTPESPQWLHDLHKRGWALVKGAVPKQRALTYAEKGEEWLEGFKLGYKRDDPSTWRSTNIPRHRYGGLFDQAPWPHSDQSAYRPHPHCIQGLVNLLPNGPEDGGLAVMDGSAPLFEQYFKEHTPPEGGWIKRDLFNWDDQTLKWFEERGCRWLKPTMDPGDFILWDSRAVHYGAAPINDNKRMAVYTCYKPIEFLSEEQRLRKVEAFKRGYMTSHDPTDFVLKEHQMAEWNILHPYGPPTVNKATQQAIGIVPYDS
ncbi:hypothetical protein K4K59_006424 [Colletotrichum sp. SAR11_240]|nr:hypothetical protein K4K59_006424 [Colletotrichum sp. SAR11_240]